MKLLLVIFAVVRTVSLGFDHHDHDKKIDIAAKPKLPCTSCHKMDKGRPVGRPDHTTCFGACHGAAPATPKRGAKIELGERQKVCESCHVEAGLVAPFAGKLGVHYPPYKLDPDFNRSFGHKMHAATDCTGCHSFEKKFAPHDRCIGCHQKTECEKCHTEASGKPQPPELHALHDTVPSVFSHTKHAARGDKGKSCDTCHAEIRTTNESELPRPTVTACASCHDGKVAFATTEACTRCHPTAPPPEEGFTVFRPTDRFTHGGPHAATVAGEPCGACHVVRKGEIASAGHKPCADSGCHLKEFGARKPPFCGACHNATEPWRHLVVDRVPAERTEIGATLDHGKHQGACETCHVLRTESSQLRPPRGHKACAGCHEKGPAPHLDQCDACHKLGLLAARQAARAKDPWSARGKFDHAAHKKPCADCHLELAAANLLTIPTPPKKTCEPCHDGEHAFSLTGTTCTRCHAGKKKEDE